MKGFVPVDIPTKKYIRAYIFTKFGSKPIMKTRGMEIGQKMHDLLQHSTNQRRTSFRCKYYTEMLRIYIPVKEFRRFGANLNESNIKNFNIFIETIIKGRFHTLMDDMISTLPNFQSNLPEVRKRIGIDKEAWSDDSMRKCYYRYRIATGKSLLYTKYFKKTFTYL